MRRAQRSRRSLISLVGAGRFELPTPSPPDWCANQAALRSEPALLCPGGGCGQLAGPELLGPKSHPSLLPCSRDGRSRGLTWIGKELHYAGMVGGKSARTHRTHATRGANGAMECGRQFHVMHGDPRVMSEPSRPDFQIGRRKPASFPAAHADIGERLREPTARAPWQRPPIVPRPGGKCDRCPAREAACRRAQRRSPISRRGGVPPFSRDASSRGRRPRAAWTIRRSAPAHRHERG